MGDRSTIEWTDATWNPITGCTLVSDGCRNCYAARLAATRLKNHPSRKGLARINGSGVAKFTGEVRLNEGWLDQPLRWRRPRRIFVCAHGDLFHESVPDAWIDQVFAVMAHAPQHVFQVLTKRPLRALFYLSNPTTLGRIWACLANPHPLFRHGNPDLSRWPLRNLWLGTSVEDQATADERVPLLLDAAAVVRFVSYEPALGPVDFRNIEPAERYERDALTGFDFDQGGVRQRIDWVIAGGESGPGARPAHPDWFRKVRDDCAAAGVPFLLKQWGAFLHEDQRDADGRDLHDAWRGGGDDGDRGWHHWDDGSASLRIGKKAAGRLLDGQAHDAFPEVRP